MEHGNHPDLHRLAPDGAGEQIRLGQVQGLIGELVLLPVESPLRVAIVVSADRMNPDAQNALLKTLEEPVGAACIVLCADDQAPILPTVVSRSARIRLGTVASEEIERLIVERGVADPVRARAAAVASGGLPGVALALAADPESAIVAGRITRQLVDLLGAGRRARLEAVATLLEDGAALEAILRGDAAADEGADGGAAADEDGAAPVKGTRAGKGRAAAGSRKPQPAERRRAALRVIAAWRTIARDLALARHGARRELRSLDLLEEIEAAAAGIDEGALLRFADRLDALSVAIEGYANPELVMDHLVLAWPRLARAA